MLGRKGLTKLLNVGDIAPDFELEGTGGVRVSLSALLKRGAITLIFYPADNTPG